MRRFLFILAVCLLIPASALSQICEPLPPPSGNTIEVDNTSELVDAVNTANPGDTILLADGTYNLNGAYLWIDTPDLTIRSKSGNREAVILDGNYVTTEIINVAASNATIADVTIKRAYYHPIHISPSTNSDITNTLVYSVHIIDPGQQAINTTRIHSGRCENAQTQRPCQATNTVNSDNIK